MDLRLQRIENEWGILCQMAAANPHRLTMQKRCPDEFLLVLQETPAPVVCDGRIELVSEHKLRLSFARFFPAVPIEAYLVRSVFHPNVHPTTGFVCLWDHFSRSDTVVDALCRLPRILSYSLFSDSPDDVMQPEALAWARNPQHGTTLPLPCASLMKPQSWPEDRDMRRPKGRRRLSPIEFS